MTGERIKANLNVEIESNAFEVTYLGIWRGGPRSLSERKCQINKLMFEATNAKTQS